MCARAHVAKSCIADTGHAALEMTCFVESFADRLSSLGVAGKPAVPSVPSPSPEPGVFAMPVHKPRVSAIPVEIEAVEGAVRGCVQSIIGTAVVSSTPLMEAGVDSLGATELQRGLSEQLSTEFEATLLFDHPSIDSIVGAYSSVSACTQSPILTGAMPVALV